MAAGPDIIAQMLGGNAGVSAGLVAKPWAIATMLLLLWLFFTLFMVIFMARRTNGFRELRASIGGKRVVWFFDDTRTAEMRVIAPSAGILQDEDYGDFIINEKGTYVDKRTRNIIIPLSSSLAVGGEVKHFEAADDLSKILGDEKELQKISLLMANGQLSDERFDALRTSINFSSLKSFANTMLPHNISAKINMEVAKRLKSYGNVGGKQIILYIIMIVGAIGLMALVLYLTVGGKSGGGTTVIYQTGQALANASKGALAG